MISEALSAAGLAMARVFLIFLVSAILAIFPRPDGMLPSTFMRQLSRVAVNAFLPLYVLNTLGSSIDLQLFGELWPIFFWGFLHFFLVMGVAFVALRLASPPELIWRSFVVVISAANTVGICFSHYWLTGM